MQGETINTHKILRGKLDLRHKLDDRLKSIINKNYCWSVEHSQMVQDREAQFFRQLSNNSPFRAGCSSVTFSWRRYTMSVHIQETGD